MNQKINLNELQKTQYRETKIWKTEWINVRTRIRRSNIHVEVSNKNNIKKMKDDICEDTNAEKILRIYSRY